MVRWIWMHRESGKGMINEVEIGSKQAAEELQDAYREMEKYKDMVVKRSEDTARTIAYSIFKAKNDSITKEKLPHQMETYLRDEKETLSIRMQSVISCIRHWN